MHNESGEQGNAVQAFGLTRIVASDNSDKAMKIEKVPYTAEVVRVRGEPSTWKWLVKRAGSEEVLTHGQESSEQLAVQNAIECIEKLLSSVA